MRASCLPSQVLQPLLQELERAAAMKLMIALENLMPDPVGRAKDFINVRCFFKRQSRRFDRKDRVARARFDEQRARRNQPGEVVHLDEVQDAGDVVVYAVRAAENAVAEGVEVAADNGDLDAFVERRGEVRDRAAA